MLRQVNATGTDADGACDLSHRPIFKDVEIEDLELSGIDLLFHLFNGCGVELVAPLVFPEAFEVEGSGVGNALDRGGGRGVGARKSRGRPMLALPELIDGTLACDRQDQALERTGGIVSEGWHRLGHGNERFLHDVLSFGVG